MLCRRGRAPASASARVRMADQIRRTPSGFSTYTRARDSSALLSSKDGILGRRADEDQRAVLDERQERVLLGLVEAMHLVEEQHGADARSHRAWAHADGLAHVLDAGEHGRQRHEVARRPWRDQPRERRLAGAGRAPRIAECSWPLDQAGAAACPARAGAPARRPPRGSRAACDRPAAASGAGWPSRLSRVQSWRDGSARTSHDSSRSHQRRSPRQPGASPAACPRTSATHVVGIRHRGPASSSAASSISTP